MSTRYRRPFFCWTKEKKEALKKRLPALLELEPDELENLGWLRLAESAFSFWEDPEEDIYNDLIPTGPNPDGNTE